MKRIGEWVMSYAMSHGEWLSEDEETRRMNFGR